MYLFDVGDLVSWKGEGEFGIVLNKRSSIINDTEDLLVRFLAVNSQDARWYSSKYFTLVSRGEK